METINITNKTMELSDCKNAWTYDAKHHVYMLEDILYTDKATTPKFQRLSIFVPEAYMKAVGEIDWDGVCGDFTARTVPVIFENNSAGYMQMPHVWLDGPRCFAAPYLKAGFVYVSCGNRGHESRDANGNYCGRSPINLVDLKTGIRFLRHNRKNIPGDLDKIISVGWSAGGAMSTLLAVTGDSKNYEELLRKNGAFMEESDAVYAAQIYCPIVDLEHADLAYEWMFHEDRENENSPAGPAEVMSEFKIALSEKLKERYIRYFNTLGLKNPEDGSPLSFGEDGRSGSAYEYFMEQLEAAATKFLNKLDAKELDKPYSSAQYLAGDYTFLKEASIPAPGGPEEPGGPQGPGGLAPLDGPGGPKGPHREEGMGEPPTLGDLVSRPPKGVPFKEFRPPMEEAKGKNKASWLTYEGGKAHISSLDDYVLQHRRRMKPCTSFDVLAMDSGENKVFGNETVKAMHFNADMAEILEELKDRFPQEYRRYHEEYAKVLGDQELERRKYLINPFSYIGTQETAKQPEHYRIRVGAYDADTSLSVSMTLALKLANAGKDVDYAMVWDEPHSEADYPGEVIDWIRSIL